MCDRLPGFRSVFRPALVAWLIGLGLGDAQADDEWLVFGHAALWASGQTDTQSWRDGGAGRYLDGQFFDDRARLSAHLGILWQPNLEWELMLHSRLDSDDRAGADSFGIVEAYAARRFFLDDGGSWRLKAGQFFLPTSREAVDPLWQSRYHLGLSSLNSWIAEEFRPIGLETSWRNHDEDPYEVELGATVFGGNDSSGALLAWRGFASHDRLSVLGEILSLPDLPTLQDEFSGQRDDGSKPFGPDLDGRPGYSLRARLSDRASWRWIGALTDNRGDRALHRGEYAWATRFWQLGADWSISDQWTFAAEHLQGRSGMGLPNGARVDIDFDTTYALASWQWRPEWRLSLRAERFRILDRDGVAENNSDRGDGITASLFWMPDTQWRVGVEWQSINSRHGASTLLGTEPETGGDVVRAEVRYSF